MIWFQLGYVLFGVSVIAGIVHAVSEKRRGDAVVDVIADILCGPARSFIILFGAVVSYACIGVALFSL